MVSLPAELWLKIAHFIGYPKILGYLTVHPIFLEYGLNTKYREAGFDQSVAIEMVRVAQRLKRPGIAPRVRIMKLDTRAIDRALNDSTVPSSKTRPRSRIRAFFDRLLRRPPHHVKLYDDSTDTSIPQSPSERLQELEDALSLLTGLNELHIHWESTFYIDSQFGRQAASLLPRINSQLHTLVLKVRLLPSMLPILAPLLQIRLENLTVHTKWVSYERLSPDECASIVIFINSFAANLKSLSLLISGHLDASLLFDKLAHFSQLRHITFSLPFARGHLVNPASIHGFLCSHPKIASLCLKGLYCCLEAHKSHHPEYYYEECFQGLELSHLNELSLDLPISQGLRDKPVARRQVASLLTSLCNFVTTFTLDETLTRPEAVELLHMLPASQLEALSLHISFFDPLLLHLLVFRHCQLKRLKLCADLFGVIEGETMRESESLPLFIESVEKLAKSHDAKPYFYTWHLQDLDIQTCQWEYYGQGKRSCFEVMDVIEKHVPSLRHTTPAKSSGPSIYHVVV